MTESKDRVNESKEFRQQMMDKLEVEESAAETIKPEENKEKYVQAMEERVAKLKVMTDEMMEKSKSLSQDARAEFDKETERLMKLYAEAKSRLNDVRQSGSDTWTKVRDKSSSAWKELADGVKKAINKFR